MDTDKRSQDAPPKWQRGQVSQDGQQIAHGTLEGQQFSEEQHGDEGPQLGAGSPDSEGMQGSEGMPAGAGKQGSEALNAQPSDVAQRRPGPDAGVIRPPVDVIEDACGITLLADLPGVSKDNLHLRLEAQSLTIEGAMTLDLPADMEPRHAEVRQQHYERTFALSRELNGEQATAELTHGVLRIRIPKLQHVVPRKIPVNAGA